MHDVRSPARFSSCLGRRSRLSGQKRVPESGHDDARAAFFKDSPFVLLTKIRRTQDLQPRLDSLRHFLGVQRETGADFNPYAGGDVCAGPSEPIRVQGDHRSLHVFVGVSLSPDAFFKGAKCVASSTSTTSGLRATGKRSKMNCSNLIAFSVAGSTSRPSPSR